VIEMYKRSVKSKSMVVGRSSVFMPSTGQVRAGLGRGRDFKDTGWFEQYGRHDGRGLVAVRGRDLWEWRGGKGLLSGRLLVSSFFLKNLLYG